MRGNVVSAILVALCYTLAGAGSHNASPSAAHFTVQPEVAIAGTRRIGVNLGTWTTWGAEQLIANVLKIPGFERLIDRAIVTVKYADHTGFSDNTAWLGRLDGFWAGARYEVRTGPSTGQAGTFWSRLTHGNGTLSVQFQRQGAAPFLSQTLQPTGQWAKTTYQFVGDDSGPAGTLELQFRASETGGRILLDDVELGSVQTAPFPFRAQVVEVLSRLHPGYLRDWQGQLGDTLANRLAEPFARRASRYRPDGLSGADFGYSLPEFLDLCRRIGANPWIVVPITVSDEEFLGLGRYLAYRQTSDPFDEILIEFGNENWNPTFRPAGIPEPVGHGRAAAHAFQKIRAGAQTELPFRLVASGQHANPAYALQFAAHARSADLLAIAPYFLLSLKAGTSRAQRFPLLFADDGAYMRAVADGLQPLGKGLAIAEVNLHTLDGDAPATERDPVTTGAVAGSALAKTLLDAVRLGAVRQCVYVLAGYDAWLSNRSGFVKLWGIVRDLTPTGRFRPTGLALMMLNRVITGDLHHAQQVKSLEVPAITLAAFRSNSGWAAALISTAAIPQDVTIAFRRWR